MAQLEALERQAELARAELEQELKLLRRSMGANIVRYVGSTGTIVLAADARSPFVTPSKRPRQ